MQTPSSREGLYFLTQILLTLMLFTMGSLVPFLGFWGTLFCPLPLALGGCRFGGRWLAAGVGITAFLMCLLYPVSVAIYYTLARVPVSVALYAVTVLNAKKPAQSCGEGLLICSVSALMAQLLLLLVFYLMTGENVLLPNVSQVGAIIQQFQGDLDPPQAETLEALVQQMSVFIPKMLPSMVMIYAGFDAVLNYKLCSKILSKNASGQSNQRPVPLPPFTDWRFPRSLLPALCSAFMLGMIANWQNWFETAMFVVNLKIVLNILFYMQGLSLAWWWMTQKNFGIVPRIVLVVVMLFPLMWLWVVMLGVMDMLLDFRARRSARA